MFTKSYCLTFLPTVVNLISLLLMLCVMSHLIPCLALHCCFFGSWTNCNQAWTNHDHAPSTNHCYHQHHHCHHHIIAIIVIIFIVIIIVSIIFTIMIIPSKALLNIQVSLWQPWWRWSSCRTSVGRPCFSCPLVSSWCSSILSNTTVIRIHNFRLSVLTWGAPLFAWFWEPFFLPDIVLLTLMNKAQNNFVREAPKKFNLFFGKSFPNMGGWGGWFPNQVQTPQNHPENCLWCSQISQKPWGGWVGSQIWENFPKKGFILAPTMIALPIWGKHVEVVYVHHAPNHPNLPDWFEVLIIRTSHHEKYCLN